MNFLSKLFKKKKNVDYFTKLYHEEILEDPSYFSFLNNDIDSLVESLTDREIYLVKYFGQTMQRHFKEHYAFWTSTEYTIKIFHNDTDHFFRSDFEHACLKWVLLTRILKSYNVRDEVGKVIYVVFKRSFYGLSQYLFQNTKFSEYEKSFDSRTKTYTKVLNALFSKKSDWKGEPIQNLYSLIILNPLKVSEEELEGFKAAIGVSSVDDHLGFNFYDNSKNLFHFFSYLKSSIADFENEVNELVSKMGPYPTSFQIEQKKIAHYQDINFRNPVLKMKTQLPEKWWDGYFRYNFDVDLFENNKWTESNLWMILEDDYSIEDLVELLKFTKLPPFSERDTEDETLDAILIIEFNGKEIDSYVGIKEGPVDEVAEGKKQWD